MYDPDRFDCEILIERSGHTAFTTKAVAEILNISESSVRTRLTRRYIERPEAYDAKGAHTGDYREHEWSKRQMINMMLKFGTTGERFSPKGKAPLVHGTVSGYNLHRNRKIPICPECREAQRVYNKAHREEVRAGAA